MSDLTALENTLGHDFSRPELLERALTHSSHAHEESKAAGQNGSGTEILDNEQFEFLGDAVLGLVTSQLLFERFPDFHEGQLSKLKAHLVSAGHLVGVAIRLGLGQYLRLGREEGRRGDAARAAFPPAGRRLSSQRCSSMPAWKPPALFLSSMSWSLN